MEPRQHAHAAVVPAAPGATAATATDAGRPPAARVPVETPRLAGSINLRGARIDDLVLTTYTERIASRTETNPPQVGLFVERESDLPD